MSVPRRVLLATALVVATVGACSRAPEPAPTTVATKAPAPAVEAGKPELGTFGFDTAGMDRSVAPGDDFFGFANGNWVKHTEIPADRSSYGSFTGLTEKAAGRTRAIIEESAANTKAEGEARKIGDYYATFMDEAAIEARGLAPIQPELDAIAAISDKKALVAARSASTLRADVDLLNATDYYTDRLFGLWVAQDLDKPAQYAPYLLQGGLGLPDRDFYLEGGRMAELRSQYEAHIAKVLELAGIADAAAKAERILALETAIARVTRRRRRPTTSSRAPTTGPAPTSRARRRAGLGRVPRRRGPRRSRTSSSSGSRRRSPASRSWSVASRSRPGRTTSRSTRSTRVAACCPRPSPTSASPSTAPRSRARRSSRSAGSARSTRSTAALGEAVGKLYVRTSLQPADQGPRRRDGGEPRGRVRQAHRRARVDDARRPRRAPRRSCARHEDRHGLSGRVARLLGARGPRRRRARQRRARRRCSSTSATSPSSASRSTAASGTCCRRRSTR